MLLALLGCYATEKALTSALRRPLAYIFTSKTVEDDLNHWHVRKKIPVVDKATQFVLRPFKGQPPVNKLHKAVRRRGIPMLRYLVNTSTFEDVVDFFFFNAERMKKMQSRNVGSVMIGDLSDFGVAEQPKKTGGLFKRVYSYCQ